MTATRRSAIEFLQISFELNRFVCDQYDTPIERDVTMYQSRIFTKIIFLALATRMLGSSAQITRNSNQQRQRVYRLDTFDPNDESYLQTTDFSHMRWDMLQTLRTIFQPPPIWGQNDHRFWSQIEFKCFLHEYVVVMMCRILFISFDTPLGHGSFR